MALCDRTCNYKQEDGMEIAEKEDEILWFRERKH